MAQLPDAERLEPQAWEMLSRLVGRGAGVCDEEQPEGRDPPPASVETREYLMSLVEHHRSNTIPFLIERCGLQGKSVLEFGSGTGGLAIAMIQAGVGAVTGVEPNRMNHEASDWRKRAYRLEDRVDFHYVPNTSRLPFAEDRFDACVCSSVLQYVPDGELRRRLLIEMHRVVKPGGLVIVCASGNGLLPAGPHSSRWWSNLAPRRAERRGDRRGVTYWEIRRALAPLGAARVRPADPGDSELVRWRRRALERGLSGPPLLAHRAALAAYALLEATVCRLTDTPIEAFTPYVTVAFRKRAAPPGAIGGAPHP